MDKIDIQLKQKQFFRIIFGNLITEGNNFKSRQFVRIFQADNEKNIIKFFKNLDDLVSYTSKAYGKNTYFTLSTTNGEGGTENDLLSRSILAFDFDKKDLGEDFNHVKIIDIFKKIGLWYHVLVDSGHGYHVYICIQPTDDMQKVQQVQKALAELLGADLNAIKNTQILRVPYTYNIKNRPKMVTIVNMFSKETIKRYDINKLYDRYCNSKFKDTTDYIYPTLKNNIPICVRKALEEGSLDGSKNLNLYNIVIYLKHKGESIEQIKKVCKEWNSKNMSKIGEHELEYQVAYNFKNCNGYRCNNCISEIKLQCKDYTASDFNLEQHGEPVLDIHTKIGRQCRNSDRKGVVVMTGNELFIYNVILNNKDIELKINDIMNLITDRKTGKLALTINTVRKALRGLEEKQYITIDKGAKRLGIKDIYKINPKQLTDTNNLRVSYLINLAVIWGRITTNELKCYVRMRYLHYNMVLEGKTKGNIFTISQEELARSLGVDKKGVVLMTKNLYDNNILDRRAIPKEDNPKQFYYEYKLNM